MNTLSLEIRYNKLLYSYIQAKRRFFDNLKVGDYPTILNYLVEIILNNLKYWSENDLIIKASLNGFLNLTNDYYCSRMLLSLETTKLLLRQHTVWILHHEEMDAQDEFFPFLREPQYNKHRTVYYTTLSTLLFIEDIPGHLNEFLLPIVKNMNALLTSDLNDPFTQVYQQLLILISRTVLSMFSVIFEAF